MNKPRIQVIVESLPLINSLTLSLLKISAFTSSLAGLSFSQAPAGIRSTPIVAAS